MLASHSDNSHHRRSILIFVAFLALSLHCQTGRCQLEQEDDNGDDGSGLGSMARSTSPKSFEIRDEDDEQDVVWHDHAHSKHHPQVEQSIDLSDPLALYESLTARLSHFYNTSLDDCQHWWSQFYEFNRGYLQTMHDNLKIVHHSLAARFMAIFVPASLNNAETKVITESSFNQVLLDYFAHWQTLVVGGAVTIIVFILVALVLLRNQQQQQQLSPSTPRPAWLRWFVHFEFVIAGMLSFLGAVAGSFRASENITYQLHSEQAAVYSIQGRRQTMEDCFTLRNNLASEFGIEYYAVYDGHGGSNAAVTAEKQIYEAILNRIKTVLDETKPEQTESATSSPTTTTTPNSCSSPKRPSFLTSTSCPSKRFDALTVSMMKTFLDEEVTRIDRKLVEQFRKRMDISGSTALIAVKLIHSNTLLVANVGDSRGILCDWKGATIPLSFDHKPYQFKEYRRIVEAGGYISLRGVYRVNGVLAVSRALGDYPLKSDRLVIADPDILTFDLNELKPRFLIMASDGFWDTFSNEAAVRYVRNELMRWPSYGTEGGSHLALALAKKLVNEAYTRESYDNITVIVVLFQDEITVGNGGSPKMCSGIARSSSRSSPATPTTATPSSDSAD